MSEEQEPIIEEAAAEQPAAEAPEAPQEPKPAKGRKARKKGKRETAPEPSPETTPSDTAEETPPSPETETPVTDEISLDDLLGDSANPSEPAATEESTEPVEVAEPVEEGTRNALPQVVEAILFASQKPMSAKEILSVFKGAADAVKEIPDAPARAFAKIKEPQLREAIEALEIACASPDRAYEVRESAIGWQLVTKPQYSPWLRQIFPEHRSARLSAPAMETLAIIAYRQPITRADIEAVRGVAVDGVMQTLLDRGLVKIAGRADVPGRPLLYDTTQNFMEHFGLKNLDDLPNAAELRKISLPTAEPPPAETPAAETPATPATNASAETTAEPAAPEPTESTVPVEADVEPASEIPAATEEPAHESLSEPTEETPSKESPAETPVEEPLVSDLQSPISETDRIP